MPSAAYQAILHFGGMTTDGVGSGVGSSYHIFDIATGRGLCYGSVSVEVNRLDTFPFATAASHYIGLIQGLNAAISHNIDSLLIRGSSQLVINHMKTQCDLNQRLLCYLHKVANSVGGKDNALFRYLAYDCVEEKDNILTMKLSRKVVYNPDIATDSVEFDPFASVPYYRYMLNPGRIWMDIDVD